LILHKRLILLASSVAPSHFTLARKTPLSCIRLRRGHRRAALRSESVDNRSSNPSVFQASGLRNIFSIIERIAIYQIGEYNAIFIFNNPMIRRLKGSQSFDKQYS
jgi:hypothetical protein